MKENTTYLEDLEIEECPFKFPKDLLILYQPERLSEMAPEGEAIV